MEERPLVDLTTTPLAGDRRAPSRGRRWRRPRAVTDVVATILILALTVVLAATVFLFVTTYPRAPVPQSDAFVPQLAYGGTTCVLNCGGGSKVFATAISSLAIQLTAGPTVSGPSPSLSSVRLGSQQKPSSFTSAFSLASGLGGSTTWAFGQTWTIDLTSYGLPYYDNISVAVTSMGKIVLQTVVPGATPNLLPYATSCTTSPAPTHVNTSFSVSCRVVMPKGYALTKPVQINLSQVPGQPTGLKAMTNSSTTWLWTYTASTGATSPGSYNLFITLTDKTGGRNLVVLPMTVVSP